MKKKCIFPVALAAAMLVPLLTSAAGVLNRITYTASYNNNGLTIGTDTLGGVTYATVSYEDLYNGGEPGMPSLPIDYLKFSVPYNATNFTVTATTRWASQNLNYLVYPCQSPWMIGSPVPPIVLPDTSAYYSGNSFPSQMAWIADEGFLAGENHIVTVAVMPFRYKHTTNSDVLSRAINCVVTLRYDLSDSLAMSPIVRNDSLLREEGYQLTQSMVVNPGQVKNFAPAQTINPGIDSTGLIQGGIGGDLINGGEGGTPIEDTTNINIHQFNYPYLIVTTSDLKNAVRRIAALKRQKGYNVKVVTMDEVLSSVFARSGDVVGEGSNAHLAYTDDAGKLRQYIKNHYQYYGTQYVLLVGKGIPYREYDCDDITGGHGDLYFSELNADWSIDSLEVERSPEVFVGRLLCSTPEQVDNYTNKLLRYELNPGCGDVSYLRSALFTEGRDYCHKLDGPINDSKSFFPNQVIIRDSIGSNFPKGCNIIDTINTVQFGFMCSFNHGSPSCIRTYGPDSIDMKRYFLWAIDSVKVLYSIIDSLEVTNGLNQIKNKYNPMIYYSLACQTMPYNKVSDVDVDINFGESFTMGNNYGGVAYLGYTTENWDAAAKILLDYFLKQIKNLRYKLGMAEALSKEYYNTGCRESVSVYHNLLGDPSLEIWTLPITRYENINISRTDSTIILSGINSLPFPSYISYRRDNGEIGLKKVFTSPCSITDASLNSSIIVFSHTRVPYIAPLFLQNTIMDKSEYVIASDVIAGSSVESFRDKGNVIIQNGVTYEIEAQGSVSLQDGFKVEKGAIFAVYPPSF